MSAAALDRPCEVPADRYWAEVRQPLVSLAFVAPLLAAYELGVLWLGGRRADTLRNGADDWLRGTLQHLGPGAGFLLPVLVVGCLLAWHVWRRDPWRIAPETLVGMAAESILFAVCLIVVGQLQELAFARFQPPPSLALTEPTATRAVTFLGAGIYEEVMFRLLLLPTCYGLLRSLDLRRRWALLASVAATSVVFSLAHYVGPAGDAFQWFSFSFRLLAGLYFAALFCARGFGVTVGCHAVYDLLVGVLLAPSVAS